jgi:RNA polymerase sigma factor (sigma-70 family)
MHGLQTGSDDAFAEVVRRHVNWVHGIAQRRLNNRQLAEDATQAVFLLLYRKAPQFTAEPALISWLHRAACAITRDAARAEARRRRRETEAAVRWQQERQSVDDQAQTDAEWRELAPMLDELIARLSQADREAVLLRYYRQMTLAQVGEAAGCTEEAARKRVNRALEKLRALAGAKGVTVSAVVLATLLGSQLVPTAPAGLAAAATTAALSADGAAFSLTSAAMAKAASLTLLGSKSIAAIIIVATVLVTGVGWKTWRLANGAPTLPIIAQIPAAPPPATQRAPRGKIQVGVILSKDTAHTVSDKPPALWGYQRQWRILAELRDPNFEIDPIIDHGTNDDPELRAVLVRQFPGRTPIDGEDAHALDQLDVIIASFSISVPQAEMDAIDSAVTNGRGMLVRMFLGISDPGGNPQVLGLNGLVDGKYAWPQGSMACEIVAAHPILGDLSGKIGTQIDMFPNGLYGEYTGTPLIEVAHPELSPEIPPGKTFSPLFIGVHGKGKIVNCAFQGAKPTPTELDQAGKDKFTVRAVKWLAKESRAAATN